MMKAVGHWPAIASVYCFTMGAWYMNRFSADISALTHPLSSIRTMSEFWERKGKDQGWSGIGVEISMCRFSYRFIFI